MDHPVHDSSMKAPIKVMLVDDDLLVRTLVSTLLGKQEDLELAGVFDNGRDALAAALRDPPAAMVVDIAMPNMGGAELTRRILSEHPEIRVLAYTSLADEQTLSDMLHAGAAGVVYKESSIDSVADAVRATCAGLSVLSPRFTSPLARPQTEGPLTDTEVEILRLVSRGMTNAEIGVAVHLSEWGVKYHITQLSEKLGASNRVTLAVAAVRLGLDRGSVTEGGA